MTGKMKEQRAKMKEQRAKRTRRCGARAEGKFICTMPSRKEETPPLWWGKDEREKKTSFRANRVSVGISKIIEN